MNLNIIKHKNLLSESENKNLDAFINEVANLYNLSEEESRIEVRFATNGVIIKFYSQQSDDLKNIISENKFLADCRYYEKFPKFVPNTDKIDTKNFLQIIMSKFPKLHLIDIWNDIKITQGDELIFGLKDRQKMYENEGGYKCEVSYNDFFANLDKFKNILVKLCKNI